MSVPAPNAEASLCRAPEPPQGFLHVRVLNEQMRRCGSYMNLATTCSDIERCQDGQNVFTKRLRLSERNGRFLLSSATAHPKGNDHHADCDEHG